MARAVTADGVDVGSPPRPPSGRGGEPRSPHHNSRRHNPAAAKTGRRAGRLAVLAAGIVVAGVAVSAPAWWPHHSKTAQVPYPLNIPTAKRTVDQRAQGQLMYPPLLSAAGQLVPLPAAIRGEVRSASVVAQTRLSLSAPSLVWVTGASWGPDVVSVWSSDPAPSGPESYQIAERAGSDCWAVSVSASGLVRYGVTRLARHTQCTAAATPASGWHPTWPPR